ncbi:hypothetical protein E4U17_007708 [Claviceps sp. LM77 group G4]|nr:hypothetical protein E4U17_007708 [Claviceps sp. LM77 group G4]KAG6077306.1 hypothetical protein E4U33_001333 [Claviceps sp. LM78 group G4]KAG6081230.1 hypothetical protein E4U16_007686 [Claviceps sp. LM84 group G4]
MPRPSLPLTSGLSTNMGSLHNAQSTAYHLAPQLSAPTMHPTAEHSSFNASSHISLLSSSSPRSSGPSQAAETVKTRRRVSVPRGNSKDNTNANANCPFSLPPPPTRSRKIIQMKPRTQVDSTGSSPAKPSSRAGSKTTSSSGTAKTAVNKDTSDSGSGSTGQGVKRKQPPNATSAAGRKTARKTAHSLIERRRRGKMNEEFDVLRSLVPACTLHMHKLSVLNCTIEYVQYLQDCVSKLSSQAAVERTSLPSIDEFSTSFFTQQRNRLGEVDISDSEDSASLRFLAQSDYAHRLSTSTSTSTTASSFSSVSPSIHIEDARRGPHGGQHHYTFDSSNHSERLLPSPALGPQGHGMYAQGGLPGSGPTSFAICAQSDVDSEATAALLMLNADRRGPNPSANARRVSVRDLLSN